MLVLFKSFVASQRPGLVIDEVATGETWFGADALARGLCDELKTTDDVLLELRRAGGASPPTHPLLCGRAWYFCFLALLELCNVEVLC